MAWRLTGNLTAGETTDEKRGDSYRELNLHFDRLVVNKGFRLLAMQCGQWIYLRRPSRSNPSSQQRNKC
jgi:hypothetical protein